MMKQSDWMSRISDNLKITQINLPGTHDSSACHISFSFISKTQSLTVSEQLNIGVRYFDFRFDFSDGIFYATHSIARCKTKRGMFAPKMTADDAVSFCKNFLRKNPTETILFQLKEAVSHTGYEFFSVFYERYIKDNENLWYTENRIPTLGEVRGKIVLLRVVGADREKFNDSNSGINFTNYPYVGTRYTDDWRKCEIKSVETENEYAYMFVQDSYMVEGIKKWGTVVRFLESQLNESDFNICLTSCTKYRVPRQNAKQINNKFQNYEFKKNKTYGIVVFDFADISLCEKIIKSNESEGL